MHALDLKAMSDKEILSSAYRLAAFLEMDDTIFTHLSVRDSYQDDAFFLPAFGTLFEEVTSDNLKKVILAKAHDETNPAGAILHSALYEVRPDVGAIVHLHTPAAIAVSALEEGLLPLSQFAMLFYRRLGYHIFEGISLDAAEKKRFQSSLGKKNALLLRNHGLVTVARNMPHAFMLAFYLERSCQIQLSAQATGQDLCLPTPEVCEHTAQQFEGPERLSLERAFYALLRRMGRGERLL